MSNASGSERGIYRKMRRHNSDRRDASRFPVECVRRNVVRLREQPERAARDDPVDVAFLRANRAVAFADAVERTSDLEADAPAMASAAIGPLDDLLFGLLLFRRFLRGRLFLHSLYPLAGATHFSANLSHDIWFDLRDTAGPEIKPYVV